MFSNANQTLIGTMFIKFGQALVLTWGKANIYYFSYYKHYDKDLSIAYNTLPLAVMAIPFAIIIIFSQRIAKLIGYVTLIRFSCFLQFISLLIAPYMKTYLTFILFYLCIFDCGYALQAFPTLTLLWSHFKGKEGKVSGIVFAVFGVATFAFIVLITYLVNPDNKQATLEYQDDKQKFLYFDYDVASNSIRAVKICGFISGILSIIGSFMIHDYQNYDQIDVEMKQVEKKQTHPLQEVEEKGQINQDQELNKDNNSDKQENNDEILDDMADLKVTPSLLHAVKSQQFIIIIICQTIITLFVFTLGINYKAYAISKIHNDYFITFADMMALLISSISNLIWGRVSDKLNFKILLTLAHIFTGICGILLPYATHDKYSIHKYYFDYVLLMMFYKGVMVIVGPGLLKIFGHELGHQLVPITYTGSILAFAISPLAQFILKNYMSLDGIFQIEGLMIIFAILLIFQIKMNYSQ